MTMLEDAKKIAEKLTDYARPSDRDLADLVRPRKPNTFRFTDDGAIPNQ